MYKSSYGTNKQKVHNEPLPYDDLSGPDLYMNTDQTGI